MEDKPDTKNRTELNILDQEEEKYQFEKSLEKEEVIIYFPEDSTEPASHSFVPDKDVPSNCEITANETEELPAAASSWSLSR